jgi:uncharacterized membrane protein HdeD (DUF308 family)
MNHDPTISRETLLQTDLKSIHDNWKWLLASGIAFVLFAAIALGYSALVTLASVFVFGWLLVFGGIFEAVHAFKIPQWSGFLLELLVSILYVVVGALMVLNPAVGAVSLTLLIAAFFLVGGIFRIVAAAALHPPRWGWLVASGLVTLLLGILIWAQWPVSGLWVIGLFVGIDMLFAGTWMIMLALAARKLPVSGVQEGVAAPSAERRQMGQAG